MDWIGILGDDMEYINHDESVSRAIMKDMTYTNVSVWGHDVPPLTLDGALVDLDSAWFVSHPWFSVTFGWE